MYTVLSDEQIMDVKSLRGKGMGGALCYCFIKSTGWKVCSIIRNNDAVKFLQL